MMMCNNNNINNIIMYFSTTKRRQQINKNNIALAEGWYSRLAYNFAKVRTAV